VHRLPVERPRSDRLFGPLNARVVWGHKPVPHHLQRQWMTEQGPHLPGLAAHLDERLPDVDAVVFFTYLYDTTWSGMPAVRRRRPVLFHPTAHDEPPLYLPLFDDVFRRADGFAWFTEEEARLVHRRFAVDAPEEVIGIGQDVGVSADPALFRARFDLGEAPYLLVVGRVDPGKGSEEIVDFFAAYKARNPGPLRLVIMGDPVRPPEARPDLVVTGFVDGDVKESAMSGSLALVVPSYFESFSMALTESWVHRRPALVQGWCDVLEGQARRSGGGVPYRGYAEFEAALDRLQADPALAGRLGDAGRRYVEANYAWPVVLDRYEGLLERAVAAWAGRRR
jgi:glycosyltransferase involved in cell wall biosynthesis